MLETTKKSTMLWKSGCRGPTQELCEKSTDAVSPTETRQHHKPSHEIIQYHPSDCLVWQLALKRRKAQKDGALAQIYAIFDYSYSLACNHRHMLARTYRGRMSFGYVPGN
ncbi:hypothetical protein J6590_065140 [Homalodisca vitripennis]|nr:hypothetical protein J6590_065140 [Homalodisca vitripennis]